MQWKWGHFSTMSGLLRGKQVLRVADSKSLAAFLLRFRAEEVPNTPRFRCAL